MKKLTKILAAIGALLLGMSVCVSVLAAETSDVLSVPDDKCSLTVRFAAGDLKLPISGAEFSILRMAGRDMQEEGCPVTAAAAFSGLSIDWNALTEENSADQAATAYRYIADRKIAAIKKGTTEENGTVSFENLEPGIYLVWQTPAKSGSAAEYETAEPFFAEVPKYSEDQKKWIRDVEVCPKTTAKEQDLDFEVRKTAVSSDGTNIDGGSTAPGSYVEYAIEVKNPYSTAKDIVVEDELEEGQTFVKTDAGKNFSQNEGTLSWKIPSVGAGETGTVRFEVKMMKESDPLLKAGSHTVKNTARARIQSGEEKSNTVSFKVVKPSAAQASSGETGTSGGTTGKSAQSGRKSAIAGSVKTMDESRSEVYGALGLFSAAVLIFLIAYAHGRKE